MTSTWTDAGAPGVAPDGLQVEPLIRLAGASTARFRLAAGRTGRAVKHRTVAEAWHVLSGHGELWRWRAGRGTVTALRPGEALVIEADTCFQVRAAAAADLCVLGVTVPAWPGDAEARLVRGTWRPDLGAVPPRPALALRDARASELAALSALALRSKAWWGYDERFLALCEAELRLSAALLGRIRVVEADGAVAGFHAVSAPAAAVAELAYLFVDPAWIGCGCGARLLGDAAALARRLGARCLVVQADPDAEPFYRRHGAVPVGQRPSQSVPGRQLPLLELALPP